MRAGCDVAGAARTLVVWMVHFRQRLRSVKGLFKLAQHWPRRLIGQTDPFPRAGAYSVQSSLATESRFLALTHSRCART